ncbi:MAG: polysaccharide pyruvyl transferase family protein [Sedimentisphaerales bacterium]|nr:polysaccharide pyruvyl transferase family protein [Sedimentisphaerales bacterium]
MGGKRCVADTKSSFCAYLETISDKKIFFEPLQGNNGDRLILMGAEWALEKSGCKRAEDAQSADVILLNGSGGMNDIWHFGLNRLESYRTDYPDLPIIVGPSTYRFQGDQFKRICEINQTPLMFFTRDRASIDVIRQQCADAHIEVVPSHDLAFELDDSDFIRDLRANVREKHVLIVKRGDRESLGRGVVTRVKGSWFPKKLRSPLSRIRNRLLSFKRRDVYKSIMADYGVAKTIPVVNQDVSTEVPFSEFVAAIRDSTLVITDRLHVGVLAHMLNKWTVLMPASFGKIEGVHEMSMSGPNSRTVVYAGESRS